ncbi:MULTISPECIES: dihydropteroate synthase [unclassified Oceanobacter]|uniref:dihydropteroate synthase n=1 Tax=unclassified Oceanobacter TaxID=2620260 RepID=UPI002736F957|nr:MULTISPECIES: dihydropteroate synthase [unclassified Oceanobacter]MDP2608105.1 dihydropteroate synthase [Oceanobacter sp. 1_MG-2023]MDP2611233.1 dihydropteroate synthase [Oceanobacter sp. 2_MG-2023]
MILQCGKRQLSLVRPVVMGIVNTTPDSFSDGGCYNSLDAALRQAERLVLEGAGIIDVGGESTRPGADPVSTAEELDRVVPVVEAIARELDVVISVDTSTAAVITESATAGAHMINDVRALSRHGAIEAAAASRLPVCLMHMQGQPDSMQQAPCYESVVDEVCHFLEQRIAACVAAGIDKSQLLIDPGFGFGKTCDHNYELMCHLQRLSRLGLPLLAGLSRKRMIAEVTGVTEPDQRMIGSVAGAVICAMKGARILRVHDVRETVEAMQVVAATLGVRHG